MILTATGTLLLATSGCATVGTPAIGAIYTDVQFGDVATSNRVEASEKSAKTCATSILGLVAWGDASVATARKTAGITDVTAVDHSATSILGIWGSYCTLVYGK